jgi:hypothetical protein
MNNSLERRSGNLPPSINEVNPTPNENAKEIEAVVKNRNLVVGYKLSDGRLVSKQEGIDLARSGEIRGVAIAKNQGNEYLRGLPDGEQENNLGSLPVITQ